MLCSETFFSNTIRKELSINSTKTKQVFERTGLRTVNLPGPKYVKISAKILKILNSGVKIAHINPRILIIQFSDQCATPMEPQKPFACTIPDCGLSFTNEDHLNVHVKKHDMVLQLGAEQKSAFVGKLVFVMFFEAVSACCKIAVVRLVRGVITLNLTHQVTNHHLVNASRPPVIQTLSPWCSMACLSGR